ncbi:MAG: hypothetical protein P4L87_24285, partial [Formivibrio sp.]|nr:hypothetical protein [Formivibrio sp.]
MKRCGAAGRFVQFASDRVLSVARLKQPLRYFPADVFVPMHLLNRYNRQLHPDERQWAKGHAKAFADYYKRETGQSISQEDAYQRLLSAGYADVDKFASDTGTSDAKAKQFITANAPGSLFQKDNEWNKPLAGGNAGGSQTPEQQARFGSRTPSLLAQQQYS